METKKNLLRKLVNIYTLRFILPLLLTMISFSQSKSQVWTLQQCLDTAQIYNKNMQISINNIEISEQKQKESKSNLIPKVAAVGEYRYYTDLPYQLMPQSAFGGPEGQFKETQFGVPHNINASLQASMPLYNPQVYGAIKTTKVANELAMLQSKKTEEQIFFEISNLYYNAQILYHQSGFIENNLENTTKLLANTKLLNEQQLAKETDVLKVQLQLEQIKTQQKLLNSKYEQILDALKFTMGVSLEQNIQIESDIQYQEDEKYKSSSTIGIQIIETQTRLLSSELKTLKNSRLPSLSLYGTYGTMGFGYDQTPDNFLKFFPIGFVGIKLSYPLFSGTTTKRKINQKKLEVQNSKLLFEQETNQNTMLISNTKRQREISNETIVNTQKQIELAESVYEQILLQQNEGMASLTDALLADNALQEAQQNYISAVIDYLKADLELKKLTGNISNK